MMWSSEHFRERWEERVGGDPPEPKELSALIDESIELQKQRDLFTPRGRRCRILAMYWHPHRGMVFKVDMKADTVVTVLSGEMLCEPLL